MEKKNTEEGMIQVYFGNGKGKTTAALGLIMRAVGHGWPVLVVQFFKKRFTGELVSVQYLPGVDIFQFGSGEFIMGGKVEEADRKEWLLGWEMVKKHLLGGKYRLIILDELAYAFTLGLLGWDECARILSERAAGTEVVITGRTVPEELVSAADLVSEVRMIKHPAQKGVCAREGIEY